MPDQSPVFYRITALWVISETFLGGFLHALRIPMTGLLLAGMSVLCMTMLFHHLQQARLILKALVLVLIFKMLLSPHAPLGAFFSVGLQGVLGFLLFSLFKNNPIAAFTLGLLAYWQSAFQKLISLSLLFGMEFWQALDDFLSYVSQQFGWAITSQIAIITYLGIYTVGGIVVGILAIRLPQLIKDQKTPKHKFFEEELAREKKDKQKPLRIGMIIGLLIITGLLYIQGYDSMVLRALTILLVWFGLIVPLLKKKLFHYLSKQQSQLAREIAQVMDLLPEFRAIIKHAWKLSLDKPVLLRIIYFIKFTFIYVI